MRRVVFVALAIALIGCGPADAESAWAAYGSLGINASRGITNTDSGAAKFAVSRELGRWVYNLGISGNYASNNGITTQEDERGRIGTTLTLSKHAFWFTDTLYDRNLFDGFAYQESVASGMGRMLLESKKNTLATELGVGYLREEPEALIYNNLGEVILRRAESANGETVVHFALQYTYNVSANAKLSNSFLIESGTENTVSTNNLSVQMNIPSPEGEGFGDTAQAGDRRPFGRHSVRTANRSTRTPSPLVVQLPKPSGT